jgi:hypothetical protein
MKIEITKQGSQWIATDGSTVCEAEDATNSLFKLLCATGEIDGASPSEIDEQLRREEITGKIERASVMLIKIISFRDTPPEILKRQTAIITRLVDELLND